MNSVTPTLSQYVSGQDPVPLFKRLDRPELTPVVALERIGSSPYAFLLESVGGNTTTARYSFAGSNPFMVFRSFGSRIEVIHAQKRETVHGDPLVVAQQWIKRYSIPPPEDAPPFIGGAVGFFSYDLVHFLEELPKPPQDELMSPEIYLLFVDTIVLFDHARGTIDLVHCPAPEHFKGKDRKELYQKGLDKLDALEKTLLTPIQKKGPPPPISKTNPPRSNFTRDEYLKMVGTCKEYIAAGDIYQANLSQRLVVEGKTDPWQLYLKLREINPSPFSAFLKLEDLFLVSASPERLVRLQGGIVETRPIAGTRPRGKSPQEDESIQRALLANEKEASEHIMLVDLERSDLGRISSYGSVEVDELMMTEKYSHVIHIVSNIRSRLAPGKDCFDVIRAVFPGGTITGVPKVRCMEIITELEQICRGPYSGSMGYISFSGNMDLNIIIRTFIISKEKTYIQVGGGIVADSNPEKEYQETLYKAEALLKAIQVHS